MNSSKIRNREILFNAISNRPKGVPLITVANHESCMDDPGLIGNILPTAFPSRPVGTCED